MEYCIAAASSPLAPPNCSSNILPKRGSGLPTFTVYISFFMWWYIRISPPDCQCSLFENGLLGPPRRLGSTPADWEHAEQRTESHPSMKRGSLHSVCQATSRSRTASRFSPLASPVEEISSAPVRSRISFALLVHCESSECTESSIPPSFTRPS